jgi:hypothetical protein
MTTPTAIRPNSHKKGDCSKVSAVAWAWFKTGLFQVTLRTLPGTTLVGRLATAPIPACSVTLEALVAEQLQPVRMRLSRQQL